MKNKKQTTKRIIGSLLLIAMMLTYVPVMTFAAEDTANPYYNRIVDENTMDNWMRYFDLENLDTSNAGGVWTDKSVFKDASAFGGLISMKDDRKNFLTALSAIAANKEVVGYSTVPTDTVLVLDLSGSMDGSERSLINSANDAITELLNVNNNNRVGVVLYSASGSTGSSSYAQSVTRILPIDRYTTASDGVYLSLSNTGRVSVDRDVRGTIANADLDNTKSFGGGTYIQAGLWEAMKMFKEMDTVIGDNNWQSGDNRMPILVLMSDGAPSTGTSHFADVENSYYTVTNNQGGPGNNRPVNTTTVYGSNVGNGNESNLTSGNAFLTQLTASYVMNQIDAHYQQNGAEVRSLFYTLGFNIGNNSVARSVMDPDSSDLTDSLWSTYNDPRTTTMTIRVKNRSGNYSDVSISKNSYATSKSYVDDYFAASGTGLANAFKSIVDEIILQSRYYPTHLEGGSPDFSGYVEFKDAIGEYMEVKDIKGILLGNILYDGHMMASKLSSSIDGGLGTPENPTELGNEFIWSIKSRLGISDTSNARELVTAAWNAGQLYYNAETGEYSNYIGWYAKADGTYVGFWDENSTAAPPADAIYTIKSYGFLGETTGSIKNSDMMYMSVQVRTNIVSGHQSVIWKIPASLVPMITYLVSLEGTSVDNAKNVNVKVENASDVSPIRLIFESGLRSDLNELNITRITDSKHIASDGVTRQFWTNFFDVSAADHDDHITTLSEFTPSKENERFYYTFDSAVHKKVNGEYVLVGENETLDENGEYYHRRYVFTENSTSPIFLYEEMSEKSIKVAKDNGWVADFETLDGTLGAYVVPAGTPARELEMYDEQKDENPTSSAKMVFHPYLSEQNNIFYVDMNLGNNGLLEVTPAQGIKLSKTVDVYEVGTSDEFSFLITVHNANGSPYTGTLDSYLTALDVVPTGESTKIDLSSAGTYTVNLRKDQSFWITGIPTGATYTVEEISDNEDYKIKSVHVNGVSTGSSAIGTVAAYFIDEVDFVNTAIGEGDLVVTKQVVDENGNTVDVNDNILFTAEVTLTDKSGRPVSGTFEASNAAGQINVPDDGKFTVTLYDGASFIIRNIPEETNYSVRELDIPNGFEFNADRSQLTGVVDATSNDRALIVNTYKPTETDGRNVFVEVSKTISGNRTSWLDGESYTFNVSRTDAIRSVSTLIKSFTIDSNDSDKKYSLDLSGEKYTTAGTYHYSITEVKGNAGGITYDTVERVFTVNVADLDMDGDLEIVSVTNEAYTTVSLSGSTYTVSADFNNVYTPTGSATITIDVVKKMQGNYRLNGFIFALYDGADLSTANEILRSTITDTTGNAHFTITYAANRATVEGALYTYYLAEIAAENPNITYDTAIYKVEVTVKDNGDGTISASYSVSPVSGGAMENGKPTFTNVFTPSASAYVTITANKIISGDRVLNANEFEFVIEAITPGAPLPASTTVKNTANGAIVFDDIEFTAAGTYVYKIYESQENRIGGFTYDSRFYEITVVVTDSDAKLYATVTRVVKANANDSGTVLSENDVISFVNTYDANDAKVTISGEKLLTGKTLQTNEFTFVLAPNNAGNPMPEFANAKNDAKGNFSFGEITFSSAGVYTYTVTELATNDDRYDFDTSVYTVKVTVTDNSRGALVANVTVLKNSVAASSIVFRNGFVPEAIELDISGDFGGSKELTGRDLVAGEFEFVLMNASSGIQIGNTVKNDANGSFSFPSVYLPEEGEYHFRISEISGDENGISYDTSVYHVFVIVSKNENGELSIVKKTLNKGTVSKENVNGVLTEVVRYEDITNGGEIVFNNTYTADPAYVTLEATKTLSGRDLVDGEFKFDLHKTGADFVYNERTLVQDDVVLSLNDDGSGKVVFMPMSFDKAGSYYYVVIEDEIDENGVTSDDTEYKVEITVTDNGKGNLVAAVKVNGTATNGSTADTIKFSNIYKASPTEIAISGNKVLSGRELKENDFTFVLYDESGNAIEAVKNTADGKFAFSAITVTEAGEYVYTLRELQGDEEGMTYDLTVYTVNVKVTDNLDGTFTTAYTYSNGTQTLDGMVFNNTFVEPTPDSPDTGDGLGLVVALAVVSGVLLLGTAISFKKRSSAN